VLLASGAFAVELAATGRQSFFSILTWMALLHAAIGLGEAVITGLAVRFLLYRRADLFDIANDSGTHAAVARRWAQTLVGGLGVAAAVAVFLAPFAYDQPDGLEFVGGKLKFLSDLSASPAIRAPIADYQLPGLNHVKLATAAAGLVGTLVVFGVAWSMASVLPRRSEKLEATTDVA
jgi:cobalt/nickel transport system permease protein